MRIRTYSCTITFHIYIFIYIRILTCIISSFNTGNASSKHFKFFNRAQNYSSTSRCIAALNYN